MNPAPDKRGLASLHARLIDSRLPLQHTGKGLGDDLFIVRMEKISAYLPAVLFRLQKAERLHIPQDFLAGHAENDFRIFKKGVQLPEQIHLENTDFRRAQRNMQPLFVRLDLFGIALAR